MEQSPDPIVRFHTTTQTSWDAMLDAIRNATKTIEFEQYIFVNDVIGSNFLKTIVRKAEEGVKIKLLFDMVGSLSFYLSDLPEHLREKGIEVLFFNPISLWRLGNITSHFFRDHRKILIIDGVVGFVGGVGIADYMSTWRDTMVEIHGEFVKNIQLTFDTVWKRILTGLHRRFKKDLLFHKDFEVLINSPRFKQRFLYHAYIDQIRNAEKYIYLAAPYFVPDRRFLRALRVAAHRGVDVRVVLPEVSDAYFVDYVQSWYITRCIKSGIKVYAYKGPFYHVKMAAIDDAWATVGSSNLDNLSFLFNYEINIASSNHRFVDSVKRDFERDISNCEEILPEKWDKRFFIRKILEVLTWPFHKIF